MTPRDIPSESEDYDSENYVRDLLYAQHLASPTALDGIESSEEELQAFAEAEALAEYLGMQELPDGFLSGRDVL